VRGTREKEPASVGKCEELGPLGGEGKKKQQPEGLLPYYSEGDPGKGKKGEEDHPASGGKKGKR